MEQKLKNQLRVLRAEKRISQEELGEKIQVSRQTIHAIENEIYEPSTRLALLIAHYFNLPVEKIFWLEKE